MTFGKVWKPYLVFFCCSAMAVTMLFHPSPARAGGVDFHIGVELPFVGIAPAPPVVVEPPPAVVVQPRPYVVYRQPVVIESAPPDYYYRHYRHLPPGLAKKYYKHRRHHRWHHHPEYGYRWHRRDDD